LNKRDKESIKTDLKQRIRLGNDEINLKTDLKYLGLIIQENMKLNKHVNYLIAKIKKYFNLFGALYGNTFGYNFKKRKILYTV
jgi:hypothetical protein